MIVGSVLPVTLRRQAEVKRAHRTAGPDHESGPSDPMFPKPLDARLSGALRLQGRSVSLNRFRNTSSDGLVIPSLHRKSIRILSRPDQRPKGAHPNEVRVRVGSDDEDSWPIDFGEVQSGCLLYPRLRTKIGLLGTSQMCHQPTLFDRLHRTGRQSRWKAKPAIFKTEPPA
jgi:hypothetical protein